MKTLPTAGDTVYIIHGEEYVLPVRILFVTTRTYVGPNSTIEQIPVDRQVVLVEHPATMRYEIIEVPKLFATEREARLVLVQTLRSKMDHYDKRFDEAYRRMIADEKKDDGK